MKKIAAMLLAVVIILALVGCDVSTRNYRRYPYRSGMYNATVDGAYDGTYRTKTGTRSYNGSEGALYNRGFGGGTYNRGNIGGGYNRAGTVNPSLGTPYSTYGNNSANTGINRAAPANPTNGAAINGAENPFGNRVVTRGAIRAR